MLLMKRLTLIQTLLNSKITCHDPAVHLNLIIIQLQNRS